jgi:hypothetical protein
LSAIRDLLLAGKMADVNFSIQLLSDDFQPPMTTGAERSDDTAHQDVVECITDDVNYVAEIVSVDDGETPESDGGTTVLSNAATEVTERDASHILPLVDNVNATDECTDQQSAGMTKKISDFELRKCNYWVWSPRCLRFDIGCNNSRTRYWYMRISYSFHGTEVLKKDLISYLCQDLSLSL